MKSILIVGQSNMAGRGFLSDVPSIYNESLHMLRNGRWQMMAEPINYDREVAGVGPASAFAQAWSLDHPDEDLGIIPCAEGGSTIDEWSPESMLMRHAISEARFAQETSEIIAILWHQGESDSLNQQYLTYQEKLTTSLTHLRTALKLEEVPLLIGELPPFLGQSGFGASAVESKEINEIIWHFSQQATQTYFVSGQDLTANPDGIHIDAHSQRRFGRRYYQAFHDLTHILTPLENEDTLVAALYEKPQTVAEKTYSLSKDFALGKLDFTGFMTGFQAIQQEKE